MGGAKLDLPPVYDILRKNGQFDHMMVGLYEELMPPCESWRNFDYSYIGPCLPRTAARLSDDLEAFLQRGSKPVYIGFGSMRRPSFLFRRNPRAAEPFRVERASGGRERRTRCLADHC